MKKLIRWRVQLAPFINSKALKQMKIAGEEKVHAIVTGTPMCTVIADGAWSKRSYKTNYSARSGMVSVNSFPPSVDLEQAFMIWEAFIH